MKKVIVTVTSSLALLILGFSSAATALGKTPYVVLAQEDSGSFLKSDFILYLLGFVAAIAIGLGIWGIASLFQPKNKALDGVLANYVNPDGSEVTEEDALIQSSIIKRAVSATETFAEKRGFLERVGVLLEKADLPARPGEVLFIAAAVVLLLFGLIFVVSKSILMALVFSLIGIGACFFVLQYLARKRLKKFEAQLPDTLHLLAGTLRAGYSLPQAMDAVSKEIAEPMRSELSRAMTETRLGRELEESLGNVAERVNSADFAWIVMAMSIQREVGGNLTELLVTVADTITQRGRLKREVAALTAEGRMSAGVLACMPPALALIIWVMNPGYLTPLFTETIGRILLGAAIFLGLIGVVWMKKVITIDA